MEQENDTTNSHDNNNSVTVKVLRYETRSLLSTLLNPTKFLKTDKGKPRDWQGLAELCGISGEKIPNLHTAQDPTTKILDLWLEKDKNEATINKLLEYLEELDRYDIVDDLRPLIEQDKEYYRQHPNGLKPFIPPNLAADKIILTRDDVSRINEGLDPQSYDAFVLFADDDIDFATQLIETMERQYNLKFCAKDRDLVGGTFEHESVITLIAERCSRLIVIISPSFFESPINKYFYRFAQAVGIEQRQRKIIPCIYKECDTLPPELNYYFKLDYRKSGKLYNFWDRLHESIKTPASKPKQTTNNFVARSISEYNTTTSKSLRQPTLKPALHGENSIRSLQHGVKFSSMCNLTESSTDKIMPEEGMMSSTSANNIGAYPANPTKKNRWIYKKLRSFIKHKPADSKSKSPEPERAKENEKVDADILEDKTDKEKTSQKEKEKKKFWTRNKEKKKQLLAMAT